MKLLILSLLVLSTTFSFGQINQGKKSNPIQQDFYTIEGTFMFEYDGTNHQIKLSTQDGVYIEFDQNGAQLGAGKFIRNSDNFLLRPESVSTYSLVNDPIKFDIINIIGQNIDVRVYISDELSEELQLIKL